LQDPVASLRRQVRECQAKLPPGWFLAAYYWDVETGGMDIDQRGHGLAHEQFMATIGIPRDGGLADLLAEAASDEPRFAAVICEDIERSGRDTFYALKLEKELSLAEIPLYATDEPIDLNGVNATTVLTRRVKQGVAEWFRLQLKEKTWRGLREHSLDGWNIGTPAYGYAADRVPHPVPLKASQGRTKTRLALDPPRDQVVARMFGWRVTDRLGLAAITARLNNNLVRYPPPTGDAGWTIASVHAILANPKYTGHMVFGRRRKVNGKTRRVPPAEWIWSPEPVHPAIITRELWDAAQAMGGEHASSRDSLEPNTHPATKRTYTFRSRIRCRHCRRRMCAQTPHADTYWVCPHNPRDPRHALRNPDHPPRVSIREDRLVPVVAEFCQTYLFGPGRAAYLAKLIPATAASAAARRDKKITALRTRLRQIDTAEDAKASELQQLGLQHDPGSRAVTALRKRVLARFTDLETERDTITEQLADLTRERRETTQHPGLLDALPHLTTDDLACAPQRLLAQLYQALDLQLLYSKDDDQVTIRAVLTDTTPDDIAAILATLHPSPQTSHPATPQASHNPAATSQATATPKVSFDPPITWSALHDHGVPPNGGSHPAATRLPPGCGPELGRPPPG
jgi:hypothetical protein